MAAVLAQDRLRLQHSFRSACSSAKGILAAVEAAKLGEGTGSEAFGSSRSRAGSGVGSQSASDPTPFALGSDATHAFWEVLSYSELLEDNGIEEAFLAALVQVCEHVSHVW